MASSEPQPDDAADVQKLIRVTSDFETGKVIAFDPADQPAVDEIMGKS